MLYLLWFLVAYDLAATLLFICIGAYIVSKFDDIQSVLDRAAGAIQNVAADVRQLLDLVATPPETGLTVEQTNEVFAQVSQIADALDAAAAIYAPAVSPDEPATNPN